jgi:hypothetical protein
VIFFLIIHREKLFFLIIIIIKKKTKYGRRSISQTWNVQKDKDKKKEVFTINEIDSS